jgi:heme oxygenase (biliverdin-IX-beta and delta-forming)
MAISQEIKTATAQSHQAVEKLVMDQIRCLVTPKDYARLLRLFANYFGGLEILIGEHLSESDVPDLQVRRKTSLIYKDLQRLGEDSPEKCGPAFLPDIKNKFQAFGAMYVIEGSSLGGKHIARMIRDKLPGTDALLFFAGYGDHTLEMWNRFKTYLDKASGKPEETDRIISTAQETFLKFAVWIRSNMEPKGRT